MTEPAVPKPRLGALMWEPTAVGRRRAVQARRPKLVVIVDSRRTSGTRLPETVGFLWQPRQLGMLRQIVVRTLRVKRAAAPAGLSKWGGRQKSEVPLRYLA